VSRLIRSKGVGIYFVTQNPMDIPDSVLGQLGNRIQHALRAYTPKEQKAVRAAATSFRENPAFKTEEVITDLGVGEALVSLLDEKGVPGIVGRTLIRPPASRLGPATSQERGEIISNSPVKGVYDESINRESAYEQLEEKAEKRAKEETAKAQREAKEKARERAREKAEAAARKKKASSSKARTRKTTRRKKDSAIMREIKREGRLIARRAMRNAVRGILGSIMRR